MVYLLILCQPLCGYIAEGLQFTLQLDHSQSVKKKQIEHLGKGAER